MSERRVVVAVALCVAVVTSSCGGVETATPAPASASTTSAAVDTTRAAVEPLAYDPDLSLSCPDSARLEGDSVLVDFGWETTIAADELLAATISYGDGRTYQSTSMADVEQNLFWHRYREAGDYTVEVVFARPDGRSSASCQISVRRAVVATTEPVTAAPLPSAPVTSAPVTRPAPSSGAGACDPNYSGCVPIASDVDCAGGSGNGPAYVSGPVEVIGSDVYGLDADGDGTGCE